MTIVNSIYSNMIAAINQNIFIIKKQSFLQHIDCFFTIKHLNANKVYLTKQNKAIFILNSPF
jgi:hypothetical protein